MIKLVAFDLDGTLTQHKTPLGEKNKAVLDRLSARYHLLMVGAGTCERIWNQLGRYPIDIIGSYGMQFAQYDAQTASLRMQWDERVTPDREKELRRAALLRDAWQLYPYAGESLEFHSTGALTFPVLGTKAALPDKLAYDPDKQKRRAMYPFVRRLFSDYNVMIGGSSSFDIVPGEYGKLNGLRRYLKWAGLTEQEAVYCGDDYEEGGNDHDLYAAGFPFIRVQSYETLQETLQAAGLLDTED